MFSKKQIDKDLFFIPVIPDRDAEPKNCPNCGHLMNDPPLVLFPNLRLREDDTYEKTAGHALRLHTCSTCEHSSADILIPKAKGKRRR